MRDDFVPIMLCTKCKMLVAKDIIDKHEHYVSPVTVWRLIYDFFRKKTKGAGRK